MAQGFWQAAGATVSLTSSAIENGSGCQGIVSCRQNGFEFGYVQVALECGATPTTVGILVCPSVSGATTPWDDITDLTRYQLSGVTSDTAYRTVKVEYPDAIVYVDNQGGQDAASVTAKFTGWVRL